MKKTVTYLVKLDLEAEDGRGFTCHHSIEVARQAMNLEVKEVLRRLQEKFDNCRNAI